ncbi:MAG: YeeE/YedE thiosulfate transporter family protein [Rhodococcus sp. (in: high G+C Gram-positive bacteria)]
MNLGDSTPLMIAAGLLAGILLGYVVQRGRFCSHSAVANATRRDFSLAKGWILGVSLASVGLAFLYLLPGTETLNQGLALRPVPNIVGGLLIGIGMVAAASCISGLFWKLGSGMLGAVVGLLGWGFGELAGREILSSGPAVLSSATTVLGDGEAGTVPGVLGVPAPVVAVPFAVVVFVLVKRSRGPMRLGIGLGITIVAGWALAAVSGASFGPSSVGAVVSVADGSPNYWLVAFLVGLVVGAAVAARLRGGLWIRGESALRYLQLLLGGVLLGAGGWIAGGCTLGHGLSGAAQLNVSSFLVVAAIIVGVVVTRMLAITLPGRRAR